MSMMAFAGSTMQGRPLLHCCCRLHLRPSHQMAGLQLFPSQPLVTGIRPANMCSLSSASHSCVLQASRHAASRDWAAAAAAAKFGQQCPHRTPSTGLGQSDRPQKHVRRHLELVLMLHEMGKCMRMNAWVELMESDHLLQHNVLQNAHAFLCL